MNDPHKSDPDYERFKRLPVSHKVRQILLISGAITLVGVGMLAFLIEVVHLHLQLPNLPESLTLLEYAHGAVVPFLALSGLMLCMERKHLGRLGAWLWRLMSFCGWFIAFVNVKPVWIGLLLGAGAGLFWIVILPIMMDAGRPKATYDVDQPM